MPRRVLSLLAGIVLAAALAVPAATAAPKMMVGIYDDAQTLYGDPNVAFPTLRQLKSQVIRVSMYWGTGALAVAKRRPASAANPNDKAYVWTPYDRAVAYANAFGQKVVFSIWGTPSWANGGAGPNRAPTKPQDLQNFARAAATRYSGLTRGSDGRPIPAVRMWLAWNEPNNPVFLSPQYKTVNGTSQIQSATDYAKLCNAVYAGVHATALAGQKVACGVTGPRGNNNPNSSRPSVSPLAFLRALKKAAPGLKFDVYAHHPYYGNASEEPGKQPPVGIHGNLTTAVTLGNIGALLTELTRTYGNKKLWITEYGYQTNPPDKLFGVPWTTQAKYLTESFAIARKNPRIDMMIWFLMRDEPLLNGWQSGLMTTTGRKKPAFTAFTNLPR